MARRAQTPPPGHAGTEQTLRQAQLELAAAYARGETGTLARLLERYPAHAAALTEYSLLLRATDGYAAVTPTQDVLQVAARATERAFAAVFGDASIEPTVAPGVAGAAPVSLKALRQARHLTLRAVAERLGLGVDVLSALEAGRIRAATVPARLTQALGAALEASVEQVRAAVQGPGTAPALLRNRGGASAEAQPGLDFLDAVLRSPEMTAQQKAEWVAPTQR